MSLIGLRTIDVSSFRERYQDPDYASPITEPTDSQLERETWIRDLVDRFGRGRVGLDDFSPPSGWGFVEWQAKRRECGSLGQVDC